MNQFIAGDSTSCSKSQDQEVPNIDSVASHHDTPAADMIEEAVNVDLSGLCRSKPKSKKTLFLESFYTSIHKKENGSTPKMSQWRKKDNTSIIVEGFVNYLVHLKNNKRHRELAALMVTSFKDELGNQAFVSFVANKLNWRPSRFISHIQVWWESDFVETRGRLKTSVVIRQMIHDTWMDNSIPSVDCRNGRQMINMNELNFNKQFGDINIGVSAEIKTNKRGIRQVCVVRRITTCTLRKLQRKIKEKHGLTLPVGTLHQYQPFFMRLPTEKEKEMCLHKYCLNLRLKFNAVMDHSRKN